MLWPWWKVQKLGEKDDPIEIVQEFKSWTFWLMVYEQTKKIRIWILCNFWKTDLHNPVRRPDVVLNYKNKTWRYTWCNSYRCWKWTRRHDFKSWTRLIAFHIALIPLGKVWIQLFSLQLWVNSRADWFLQPWWGN